MILLFAPWGLDLRGIQPTGIALAHPHPARGALLRDLIFICFRQLSAAATGKYLAALHAVVQHTGKK